jgi:predicted permease
LPLALIAIGGSLAGIQLKGQITHAFAATFLKLIIAPAIGFLVAQAIGLSTEQTKVALIYLACPSAAMSYVLANQIGGNDSLAASTVVISSALAVLSLGAVLAL